MKRLLSLSLLIVLISVASVGHAQPGRVILRFDSGAVTPPPGRSQGTIDDFRIPTALRQSLRGEGITWLEKAFPTFQPEDRFSTNRLGERILLEDLSAFYYAEPGPGWSQASFERLRATKGIREVGTPQERQPHSIPNDPLFPQQWWLNDIQDPAQDNCTSDVVQDADINAPEAWDIHTATGPGASNIRVGVIDSGIDPNHEDLFGNIELGPAFSENDVNPSGGCNEIVEGCNTTHFPPDSRDTFGHGTAVAGIIAGKGNNGLGVAGIAWGVTPVSYKVSSPCQGIWLTCWIVDAVDYARTASPPVQILNMSFGGTTEDPAERAAMRNAFYTGQLLVASMGNDNNNNPQFPAAYKGPIFSVGAIFDDGQRWDQGTGNGSNYGDWIDIAAPGGTKIITTKWSGVDGSLYYTCASSFGGTSAAAPTVAGTAALVLSANSSLTGGDLQEVLSRTARNVGDPGWDQYTGAGLVRADAALNFVVEPRRLRHDLSGVMSNLSADRVSRTFKGVQGLVDNQPYQVNRHLLQTTFTWSPIYELPPDTWVRGSGTLGIQDMPFYDNTREVMGGNVVNVSAGSATQQGSATVETYVYEVLQPDSTASIWFPVTPAQARVASTSIGGTRPAPIQLTGDVVYTNKVSMYWTAPGNDGYVGKAKDYDFRWSLVPITEGNWYSQNQAAAPKPGNPGTVQSITVKNLQPCTWHYFAVRTVDNEGNLSKISNVLHVRTLCGNGATIFPASMELEPTRDSGNSGPATLKFGVPESQSGRTLELAIYDISGRQVRVLKQGDAQAGRFTETWDMATQDGRRAGAGVYFVRLRVGDSVLSKRLVVLPGPGEE